MRCTHGDRQADRSQFRLCRNSQYPRSRCSTSCGDRPSPSLNRIDRKPVLMNEYAAAAKTYFQQCLPSRARRLTDQDFVEMGEQMETEALDLADQMAGRDQPAEGHLEKVGRLNRARSQARELVLHEHLFSIPPEPEVQAQLDAAETDPQMDAIRAGFKELQDLLNRVEDENS